MQNTYLCIVIPTFNRKEQLFQLLSQLQKQKLSNVHFGIVVVVDGSTDGTTEMLRSDFPTVSVVQGDGNWWFTRSMNEGCKYAIDQLNATLILTSNDDLVLPDDHYLQNILKNYTDCGGNCVIGSAAYSLTKPRMITFSGLVSQSIFTLKNHKLLR